MHISKLTHVTCGFLGKWRKCLKNARAWDYCLADVHMGFLRVSSFLLLHKNMPLRRLVMLHCLNWQDLLNACRRLIDRCPIEGVSSLYSQCSQYRLCIQCNPDHDNNNYWRWMNEGMNDSWINLLLMLPYAKLFLALFPGSWRCS